jgi:hypothetical protein
MGTAHVRETVTISTPQPRGRGPARLLGRHDELRGGIARRPVDRPRERDVPRPHGVRRIELDDSCVGAGLVDGEARDDGGADARGDQTGSWR